VPAKLHSTLLKELQAMGAAVESDKAAAGDTERAVLFCVEPGAFRRCDSFVREHCGKARLEVVELAVQQEGDSQVEFGLSSSKPEVDEPACIITNTHQVDAACQAARVAWVGFDPSNNRC
jgi:hypothetical protein